MLKLKGRLRIRAITENHVALPKRHDTTAPHQIASQPFWSRVDLLLPSLLTLPVCISIALAPDHSDSSFFLYVGQRWAEGKLPYVQVFDNKPPGIFALIALVSHVSRSLWWIALIQLVFVTGAIFGVRAILKWAGAPRRAVFFGTFCAALAVNTPFYSPGNMTESYMLWPMVASMAVFLRALDSHKLRDFFLAGLCSGVAWVFKPFGLSVLLAQAAFLLPQAVPRRCIRSAVASVTASILGAAAAWIPFIFYFWRHGALKEMLDASFLYSARYSLSASSCSLTSLSSALRIPSMLAHQLLPLSTMVACLILGACQAYKTRADLHSNRRQAWALTCIWFAFGLLLVLAAGHGYEQYFISLMPALALAAGMFFWWSEEQLHGKGLQPVIAVLVLAPVLLAYFPAVSRSARLIFSQQRDVAPDEMVSRELRRVAVPGNTLMVCGYEPWIFYSTPLRNVSRYPYTFFVYLSPSSYDQVGHEILKDMRTTPPDFVVVSPVLEPQDDGWIPPNGDPFKDQFMGIVKHSYVEFSQILGYELYRRK